MMEVTEGQRVDFAQGALVYGWSLSQSSKELILLPQREEVKENRKGRVRPGGGERPEGMTLSFISSRGLRYLWSQGRVRPAIGGVGGAKPGSKG